MTTEEFFKCSACGNRDNFLVDCPEVVNYAYRRTPDGSFAWDSTDPESVPSPDTRFRVHCESCGHDMGDVEPFD